MADGQEAAVVSQVSCRAAFATTCCCRGNSSFRGDRERQTLPTGLLRGVAVARAPLSYLLRCFPAGLLPIASLWLVVMDTKPV